MQACCLVGYISETEEIPPAHHHNAKKRPDTTRRSDARFRVHTHTHAHTHAHARTHVLTHTHSAFFIASISAAAYLSMATGNGILVLRKSGTGLKATWGYSNPLIATEGDAKHPNPFYDRAYARAPTYPFFYARYIQRLLTSPMMVHYICQVVGVPRSTTWSLLFTSVWYGEVSIFGLKRSSASLTHAHTHAYGYTHTRPHRHRW